MPDHPLDNPVWTSLTGPHETLAERKGRAARYLPDVTPFAALPLEPEPQDWADLAALAGPGETVVIAGPERTPPAGWTVEMALPGVQMDGSGMQIQADPEALVLGPDDVPEMLDLVERTRPGPFLERTRLTGTYLGIRRDGALVAMAGERLHPPGWTEISAVCTDPAFQGHGLGGRLVRAVGAAVRERGDVPMLHASAANVTAIRLYGHLGFTVRQNLTFMGLTTPA